MLRIRELRLERNMTQMDLAMELDLGNTTLQQYETGLREPNFKTLIKIADYFGVTIDYLIGRTPVREPLDTETEKLAYQLKNLRNQKAVHAALSLLEEVREFPGAETTSLN